MRCAWMLCALAAVTTGCRSSGASPPLARALPEALPPFFSGPLTSAAGYVRRTYSKGDRQIQVTVAENAVSAEGYQGWVQQSQDYPQATLEVSRDSGTGFYTCSGPDSSAACDLHIQLRAGFHLEILGGSKATRADIEQLLPSLPLRALARGAW